MLKPVTPAAPSWLNRKPPTTAPTMPRTMSSSKPWPSLLTTLLAMKPAISPSTIQPMIDMRCPFLPGLSGDVARGARAQVRVEQDVGRANGPAALGRAIRDSQLPSRFHGPSSGRMLELLGFPCASQLVSRASGRRKSPHFRHPTLYPPSRG